MCLGISNLPNQRHRRVAKKGAHLTMVLVGPSGVGKSTFINTLFSTHLMTRDHSQRHKKATLPAVAEGDEAAPEAEAATNMLTIIDADFIERNFDLRLTLIDTPGFADQIDNTSSWDPIVRHLESQLEGYLHDELLADRSGLTDNRVHLCLYFIEPHSHHRENNIAREDTASEASDSEESLAAAAQAAGGLASTETGGLSLLDIVSMRKIGQLTNLVPVIAKADTLTPSELASLKDRIRQQIAAYDIPVYRPPPSDDEEASDSAETDPIPFAVICSEEFVDLPDGRSVRGRKYAWGVAEVDNPEHCDFDRLRSLLLRTHLFDIIHRTEVIHYERFRNQALLKLNVQPGKTLEESLEAYNSDINDREHQISLEFSTRSDSVRSDFEIKKNSIIEEIKRLTAAESMQHATIADLESQMGQLVEKYNAIALKKK